MENIKPGMFFIAADGDGIGKLVGRAVIANDADELHSVSNRIDAAQDYILHWCKDVGGIKVSGGGDEFTAAIPPEAKEKIQALRKSIEKAFGYTISVGVGRSLSEAGTALLVAKLRGKDRIVYFNKHIKEDIKKAKRRVRENRATQEEYKLSEAYLEKSESMLCDIHKNNLCDLHKHEEGFHNPQTTKDSYDPLQPNPDSEDNRTDDCNMCADLDAEENADGTAGMHEGCPACAEYDAKNGTTGGIDDCSACEEYDASPQNTDGIDDCPYCQTENISEIQAHPNMEEGTPAEQGAEDHHKCNCPDCPQNDQTGLAVEDAGAQRPECPECDKMYSEAVENQPGQTGQQDPNMQGHETAEEVLDLLDQEPGSGAKTPTQEAKQIDNTELPQGDQMKEGTSVPENFGQAQKGDVSDSEQQLAQGGAPQEDAPDMSSVLQSGLDDHANEEKKAQVLDMVAQTLQGFKANKASLEASKEQNQGLYNSCIQMLKSMIELCKLMGLEPKMPTQAPNDPGAVAEATQAGAPDAPKQAAPAEGAAEDPKAQAG